MMNEDTAEDLSYDLEGLMEEFEGLSQTSFAAERPQGDGNLDNAAQIFEHNDGEWNSFDYGQHHPDWLQFLESFKSAAAYKKVVSDFLAWQHDLDEENSILERLKLYFTNVLHWRGHERHRDSRRDWPQERGGPIPLRGQLKRAEESRIGGHRTHGDEAMTRGRNFTARQGTERVQLQHDKFYV